MITAEFNFTSGEHRLAGTKVLADNRRPAEIIHLHGLGPTADRHGVRYLLDELAEHGYGSITFEFSGNGDSTGVLKESTLGVRRAESLAAAAHLGYDQPPVLMGTSMGAHLAAALVPALRPRALVLFVHAAYPAGSDDDRFYGTLAKPANYPDSPAFAGIREFDGDLLIVAAEHDQVVPADVVDGYLANATKARSADVHRLDCDHFVHRWLPHQATVSIVHKAILRIVAAGPVHH